jgi:PPOX class probable FMN-dependent enzyme
MTEADTVMAAALAAAQAVTDDAGLDALYAAPMRAAIVKETDRVTEHYAAFIAAAPFFALATVGPKGLECSPRGDAPGFVRVHDPHTLLIPDRRGNNRIDALRNLVRDPRAALLFLIPGVGESLRVIGRVEVLTGAALCDAFAVDGKAPATVLRLRVERVLFQCSKALTRSGLWRAETQIPRDRLPSPGDILAALSAQSFDAAAYDSDYPGRMKATLY